MLTLPHLLYVSAALFAVGAYGILTAQNLLIILMGIEVMLAGVSLSLVVFSRVLAHGGGQVMVMFVIAVAAAEAAIGLAILVGFFRQNKSVDADRAASMQG